MHKKFVENEHAPPQRLSASQYQVLRKLGDRAQIPVIATRYASDFSRFKVVPVNQSANEFLPKRIELTEGEFVSLLYRMRGVNFVPSDVLNAINNTGKKYISEQLTLGFLETNY